MNFLDSANFVFYEQWFELQILFWCLRSNPFFLSKVFWERVIFLMKKFRRYKKTSCHIWYFEDNTGFALSSSPFGTTSCQKKMWKYKLALLLLLENQSKFWFFVKNLIRRRNKKKRLLVKFYIHFLHCAYFHSLLDRK